MKKRLLGSTDIYLSEVGYGAAALFGKDVLGKQGISEDIAYELIHNAVKLGISFFDTGFNYGYSEERLGRCLKKLIGGAASREDIVVETKFGETLNSDGSYGASNWTSDWIKRSFEISLQRLQLDYIDLYAMHGAGCIGTNRLDEVIRTLQDLKSQRLIRAFGVNTFEDKAIRFILKEKCFGI